MARVDPDYPLTHVPRDARKGLASISVVLLGFTFFYATMYAGAKVGSSFRYWPDLYLVLLTGSLILGFYVAALAAISARTGLTTVLLARYSFGDWGSKATDVILGGTQLGWFGVTVALMAKPFTSWLQEAGILHSGWNDTTVMVSMCLLWAFLHSLTAYYGYRGMETLSFIAVPLIVVLGGLMALKAFSYADAEFGGIGNIPVKGSLGFGAAVTLIVGTFASGGTQAPNWARFARSTRTAFWAALIAFLIGNGLMLWFGAIGGNVYNQPDFAEVLKIQGFLGLGLLLLVLNVWTTNDNAAYAFGVAGANLLRHPRKKPFIVFCGIFGFIIAVSGAYDIVLTWMTAMGILIPPVGGVILGDYFLVRRCRLPRLESVRFVRFRPGGIAGYVLGAAAAYFSEKHSFLIPALNGIVVAAVSTALLHALFRSLGFKSHAPREVPSAQP